MPDPRYSDANPPPPTPLHAPEVYVMRIKSNSNPKGAAWRLCTIMQPRSVEELMRAVWPAGAPPRDLGAIVIDEHSNWIAAGKPGVHVQR